MGCPWFIRAVFRGKSLSVLLSGRRAAGSVASSLLSFQGGRGGRAFEASCFSFSVIFATFVGVCGLEVGSRVVSAFSSLGPAGQAGESWSGVR